MLTDLIAYYSLDESSGNALDAHGSKDLTDNNTVGSAAGVVSGARALVRANSEYFSRSDTAFSLTGDLTVSAWVKSPLSGSHGTYSAAIASYMTGDQAGDWWVGVTALGAVVFGHFATAGANGTGRRFTANSTVDADTWTHVLVRRSGSTFSVWVDGSSVSLTEDSTASGWSDLGFAIGRHFNSPDYYLNGEIDEVGVWSRALNDAEVAYLYNDGAGRSYADLGSAVVGSHVFGVTTRVTASRAVAFGLDGEENTHSTDGELRVFGAVRTGPFVGEFLTSDPASPANGTWWVVLESGSPSVLSLKARVAGVTEVLATVNV